jgi:hypothetical protein
MFVRPVGGGDEQTTGEKNSEFLHFLRKPSNSAQILAILLQEQ